jgi:excisionase family DNA binding protein
MDAPIQPDPLIRRERDDSAFVSPSRLARHWGVHINTIYRDIRKGALPASRMPGGQFRIRITDARRYGRPIE